MIYERATAIADLSGRFQALPRARLVEIRQRLERGLRAGTENVVDLHLDAAEASRDEVIAWLLGLMIADCLAHVIWFSDDEGLTLLFKDFASHYDELWCPSADDVVVSDDKDQWMLNIDHEERFLFRRRSR